MLEKLRKLTFLLLSLISIGLIAVYFTVEKIRFNFTASMPIGFYQRVHRRKINHGDIVSVCLPKSIALVGKARGYIGNGLCSSNTMPVLKTIIAIPGDTVVVSLHGIRVNHHYYPAPQQVWDHRQMHIKRWTKHKKYKQIKTVWLYGSHDFRYSWDSRYFGGVRSDHIVGVYKRILR